MKVIVYNRKSTKDKEDQQILSIQGQKEENLRRIQRDGLTLIEEFDEEWSAKQPGRPMFAQMLSMIEQGKADAIVCWKLNRLARNPIDGGRIQWLLQQGVLQAIITAEKTYLPSDNVIQMSVEFGMATQYSIDLSKDVKRGMLQKAKMGWRPGKAAIGYINDYAGFQGEKQIMVDEERFEIIRKCWDMLLTGAYTVPQILERATNEWGLTMKTGRGGKHSRPVGLSTMYAIFTNYFYTGSYDWDGDTYRGLHQPMITQREFEDAQRILGKKGKPRMRKYLNPYAGLIQCGECGAMIVVNLVEKKIKTTGETKTYRYYRCGHNRKTIECHQNKSISESALEEQLQSIIGELEMPQAIIEWCLAKLKLSQEDRMKSHRSVLSRHQWKFQEIAEKIDTLVDRQLSETTRLPEDLFDEKLRKLRDEKGGLRVLIEDFTSSSDQWTDDVVNELNFTLKLREKFVACAPEKRLEILHRVGQVIQLKDGKLDFRFREPFSSLVSCKVETQAALGDIQLEKSLQKPLSDIEFGTLEKVESIWSG